MIIIFEQTFGENFEVLTLLLSVSELILRQWISIRKYVKKNIVHVRTIPEVEIQSILILTKILKTIVHKVQESFDKNNDYIYSEESS